MSGGHFDYKEMDIYCLLKDICEDRDFKKKYRNFQRILKKLNKIIYYSLHNIDYDLSCDTSIEDVDKFEMRIINKLRRISETK